jgi:hypothetical protein
MVLFAACGTVGMAAAAQLANPDDADIRGLHLGMEAATMPAEGYYALACGSNGGPPLERIGGWADFASCVPGEKGLHEVYVEFDDQLEYFVRAFPDIPPDQNWLNKFAGTKIAGHPVIVSVLFDDQGVAQGLRAVSDPRAEIGSRRRAYLLRNAVKARYGVRGWECVDLPPEPGETPVGELFIKERCEKVYNNDRRIVLNTQLLRRPGQDGVDEAGNFVEGEYESSTRLEIWSLAL